VCWKLVSPAFAGISGAVCAFSNGSCWFGVWTSARDLSVFDTFSIHFQAVFPQSLSHFPSQGKFANIFMLSQLFFTIICLLTFGADRVSIDVA